MNGLKALCKRLKVWQEPEVDLRGISVRSNLPINTKNKQLLEVHPEFASCVRMSGTTPFFDNATVVDNLELLVLNELPPGDIVFFPFAPINQPLS